MNSSRGIRHKTTGEKKDETEEPANGTMDFADVDSDTGEDSDRQDAATDDLLLMHSTMPSRFLRRNQYLSEF